MELANRTLRDRLEQALVVGIVLFAFQYYRGAVDLGYLLSVTALFAVIVLGIDLVRQRVAD